MSRVVIWGTGKTAAKALHSIKQDVEIVGFVDSSATEGQTFFDKSVVLPESMTQEFSFDLLIIC